MIIASKHFPRIATGAVLVGVLGTALYLSGPYLFGLLLLFTLVGLWEFYTMFWPLKANIGGRILGLALGGLLITAAPEDADALLRELRGVVPSAQRIGVVEAYNGGPRISLR